VWMYDVLQNNPNVAGRARLVELNPLFHFVELIRRPMLGQDQQWHTWFVVIGITVVGWGLALLVMRRYRGRVAYWV
jgi:ABC-2 type transport system permease protein